MYFLALQNSTSRDIDAGLRETRCTDEKDAVASRKKRYAMDR